MKVLLSWLREFAPFEGDPVALGNTMSGLGMAVEELVHIGANLDGIVVARVLELRAHPSADRIQLVDVDAGDGNALQICCGAFNMSVGDLVPLATLGTTMANGMRIDRRKLRGEWSNGMLCSARELAIGSDAEGIMILDPRMVPGTPLADALGIERDVLYDLDLTGNRPDALSVAGVARDLAAKLHLPFAIAEPVVTEVGGPTAQRASVTIVDGDACGRFVASILDNVHIEPSSPFIANRLTLCGMRPINNVVDVSNYVMLELGQPNHTFDLRKLANQSAAPGIRVRRARAGERIVTLDDIERQMVETDLLICDQDDRPVGIAGVMGGANTEIDDATTSVLLEMAWFEPGGVAATARRLGLRSEASLRFERGTDHEHIDRCARRFAELVAPSGFTLAPGAVDARGQLPSRTPVRVRPAAVNALLGTNLSGAAMRDLLTPIGFESSSPAARDDISSRNDAFDVVVPPFRPDTTTETDIAEEVARQYGYDRIEATVPSAARSGGLTPRQQQRRRVRHLVADLGAVEAMPMPFLAPGDIERAGLGSGGLVIANPLAAEESILRTSLRPGLLRAVAHNESHRLRDVSLFEIGHVYATGPERPPAEREAGPERPPRAGSSRERFRHPAARTRTDRGHPRRPRRPGCRRGARAAVPVAAGRLRARGRRGRGAASDPQRPRARRWRAGRRGGRDPSRRVARPPHRRPGRVARSAPRRTARSRRHGKWALHPGEPLSVERYRSRFRGRRLVPGERRRIGAAPRRRSFARRSVALRRLPRRARRSGPAQPRVHVASASIRSHPHRRRRRGGSAALHRRGPRAPSRAIAKLIAPKAQVHVCLGAWRPLGHPPRKPFAPLPSPRR